MMIGNFGSGSSRRFLTGLAAVLILTAAAGAPACLAAVGKGAIYTDSLQNGWQSWPWAKKVNLANSKPVHSGKRSILVVSGKWDALSLNHKPFVNSAGFNTLSFWISANGSAPQIIKVVGLLADKPQKSIVVANISAGNWTHVAIPLASLGVANKANFSGIWFQDGSGKGISVVIDDIGLN